MKLRMMRYSGLPVTIENLASYNAEFKQRYDLLKEAAGLDMLKLQQDLVELDKELTAKWNVVETVSVPTTKKAWNAFIKQYESPVMLATSAAEGSEGELVLVLMDQPLR